jgi:hypothetical protein
VYFAREYVLTPFFSYIANENGTSSSTLSSSYSALYLLFVCYSLQQERDFAENWELRTEN